MLRVVSNPHRYGQREPYPVPPHPLGLPVSNPHRYGQRLVERVKREREEFRFQTLIGTVKGR